MKKLFGLLLFTAIAFAQQPAQQPAGHPPMRPIPPVGVDVPAPDRTAK